MAKWSTLVIDVQQTERLNMRIGVTILTVAAVGVCFLTLTWNPKEKFIWNRTHSAPIGLYWLSDGPYKQSDWVIVSANNADAQWAEKQGYVGRDWPLVKQVFALPGDTICRDGVQISINGERVSVAKLRDQTGRALPRWSGCVTLKADQVFLLNKHPDSLDGRYFGPTQKDDLMGRAHKVELFSRRGSADEAILEK
ncbi:MAG: S26 family signal peptidase [Pseudomonadota bacterium]